MRFTFTITFLLLTTFGFAQTQHRYAAPIFKDYNIYENIIYAESTPYLLEGQSKKQLYALDFYEPANDFAVKRPVILLFPDGDFIIGNKKQDEIVNQCKMLTSYGYTCACVNYRQGYDASQNDGINQAIFRGVQDARAAIRYLLENQQTFRINSDKIYVGGSRSGAAIALHTAFLDSDELKQFTTNANCLDCNGNPFEHDVNIAGVVNIDGTIYNRNIIANNKNIPILNLHINGQQPLERSLGGNASADLTPFHTTNSSLIYLHQYLDSLHFKTNYQQLSKNSSMGFADEEPTEITSIANFLQSDITFKSPTPRGKSSVCVNSTSTFDVSFEKNCTYNWIIENGQIINQDNNTIEVKWNANVGKGKVIVEKTDASGATGLLSSALIVEITPQPFADFEIQYLSDNTIKIKDKSLDANLLSIDFGYEGMMYQGKPQTNASFTYEENGTYFLTQTVENGCGIATQSVPVDISTSLLYQSANFQKALNTVPSLVQKGVDASISVKELKNIEQFMISLKDTKDEILSELVYTLDGNDNELPIFTSSLNQGIYFVEFSTNGNILATKRVRVK
ncbi:MAG: hypothetical protein AB8G11_15830 [Saprospiraceae bacterium]